MAQVLSPVGHHAELLSMRTSCYLWPPSDIAVVGMIPLICQYSQWYHKISSLIIICHGPHSQRPSAGHRIIHLPEVLVFRDDNILLISAYIAISVEVLHRNPNFTGTNMLLFAKWLYNHIELFKKFWKILEVMRLVYNFQIESCLHF